VLEGNDASAGVSGKTQDPAEQFAGESSDTSSVGATSGRTTDNDTSSVGAGATSGSPPSNIQNPQNRAVLLGYALKTADGIFQIPLPRPAAMFGRAQQVGSLELAGVLTVSRNQFYYSYQQDGSLLLSNLSDKGTLINHQRLAVGEQASVQPPAQISFGGLDFMLVAVLGEE
jgi:hypothetical protein